MKTNDGVFFLVADSVSGDYSHTFKNYDDALSFYNDDEAGAPGEYDVELSAALFEEGELIEALPILLKSVSK